MSSKIRKKTGSINIGKGVYKSPCFLAFRRDFIYVPTCNFFWTLLFLKIMNVHKTIENWPKKQEKKQDFESVESILFHRNDLIYSDKIWINILLR